MKAPYLYYLFLLLLGLNACTKKTGKNPSLAYSDQALLDSCMAPYHMYYKNNPVLFNKAPGSNSPHGSFKLRFNVIAFNALTDSGRLPLKVSMPEGAMVIKDLYHNGEIDQYSLMYKHSGSWLWAEIKPNRQVLYSVKMNPDVCINCHNQQNNRDLLMSFEFY